MLQGIPQLVDKCIGLRIISDLTSILTILGQKVIETRLPLLRQLSDFKIISVSFLRRLNWQSVASHLSKLAWKEALKQ
jgi:hypothetical protein